MILFSFIFSSFPVLELEQLEDERDAQETYIKLSIEENWFFLNLFDTNQSI